jgi:hypothetical protein
MDSTWARIIVKHAMRNVKGRNGIYAKSVWFSDAMAFSWKVSRG